MKVVLKRKDVLAINDVLSSLKGNYVPKFKYALKKNKDVIKGEIDAIEEAKKTNCPKYEEFEQKQGEKLRECVEFDAYGQPVSAGPGRVKIREDKVDEFKTAMILLEETYKDAIAEREIELKEFMKMLEETVELEIHAFNNDDVPVELEQDKYDIIFSLIQ